MTEEGCARHTIYAKFRPDEATCGQTRMEGLTYVTVQRRNNTVAEDIVAGRAAE